MVDILIIQCPDMDGHCGVGRQVGKPCWNCGPGGRKEQEAMAKVIAEGGRNSSGPSDESIEESPPPTGD